MSPRSSPQTPGQRRKRPSELDVLLTPQQSAARSPIGRTTRSTETPSPRDLRAEKRRLSQQTHGSQKKDESIVISDDEKEELNDKEVPIIQSAPPIANIAQCTEEGIASTCSSQSQTKTRIGLTQSEAKQSECHSEDVIVDTPLDHKQTSIKSKSRQSPRVKVSQGVASQDTQPIKTSQSKTRARKSFSLTPGSELNSEEMIGDTPQEGKAKLHNEPSVNVEEASNGGDEDEDEVPPTPPQTGKALNSTYTVSPNKTSSSQSSLKFKKPLISRLPKMIGTRRRSSSSTRASSSEQDSESLLAQNIEGKSRLGKRKGEISSPVKVEVIQDNAGHYSGECYCLLKTHFAPFKNEYRNILLGICIDNLSKKK